MGKTKREKIFHLRINLIIIMIIVNKYKILIKDLKIIF